MARSMRDRVGGRGHSDVELRGGLGGDHVRPQPPVDGSHVHRDAAVGVVEGEELLHLMRELEDRAHPALRVDAGVRGPSGDRHGEGADGLAARLQGAAAPERRLEHQGAHRSAGEPRDVPPRVAAADLLVAGDHQHRRDLGLGSGGPQRAEGEDRLDQAPLHVEDARPEQPAAVGAHGHLLERADGPDRVEVADQQLVGEPPSPVRGACQEVPPAPSRGRLAHPVAEVDELGGEEGAHSLLGAGVGGGRLRPSERHQHLGHLVLRGSAAR